MIKKRSKKISLLLVLMMLATMFVGVGTASAAGTIQALTTPTISDTGSETLGKIRVTIPAGVIASGDSVVVNLPDDYEFKTPVSAVVATTDTAGKLNEVYVPTKITTADANSLAAAGLAITGGAAGSDSFTITATADQLSVNDGVFYVVLDDIDASSASTGNAVVTFDGSTNTGFARGEVIVGMMYTSGEVTLSTSSRDTSNNTFAFTLRVKESLKGSLLGEAQTIKIKLPSGYAWTPTAGAYLPTTVWGDSTVTFTETTNTKGDTLYIQSSAASSEASAWETTLNFYVDDDEDVVAGDIEATVSGGSTFENNKIIVGTYGDFDAAIAVSSDVPTIYAGFQEEEIAEITVTESMKNSLQNGRTITLTLPAKARWQNAVDGVAAENFAGDKGITTTAVFTGSDDRTVRYTLAVPAGGSTDKAELELDDVEVMVEPGFTGDLVVTVGGNAGISGELIVAKVIKPIDVKVSTTTDVQIGSAGQLVGDITITENEAGALKDGNLDLRLPIGISWSAVPTVSVEEGNIKLDSTKSRVSAVAGAGDNRDLRIPVSSDSTVASTIKITGAKITIDRTVAEGNFSVSARGAAAADTGATFTTTTAASAVLGRVVTAAGGNVSNTTVFTFGATTYTVNGVEKTMDVAPYAKNNRTYMPIRYVAYALGIDDNNIIWDQASSTVTLMKGDKVVQLKLGTKNIVINGASVTMDVAVEASDNRTFLPAAWVAQAFGATATWDADTNTVTIK